MSDNQIAVSHIEIKIRDNTLRLSPEEFRELRDILNATFPAEVKWYPAPAPVFIPAPSYPLEWYPPKHWDIGWPVSPGPYCGDSGSALPQTMCLSLR
jgi:hypothetical protein